MKTVARLSAFETKVLVPLLLIGTFGSAFAQSASPLPSLPNGNLLQRNAAADTVIVSCSGAYIKANLASSRVVASGSLPGITASGPRMPRLDGCLVDEVLVSRSQAALLAVVARDRLLDVSGKRRYSIASFDLTTLKERGVYDIPSSQSAAPKILLSTGGSFAFVTYSSVQAGGASPTIARVDISSMRSNSTAVLSEASASKLSSSRDVLVDDVGRILISSKPIDNYLSPSANVEALRAISSYWTARLASEFPASQSGPSRTRFAFAASSAGVAIYIAGWDMKGAAYENGALIGWDLANNAVIGGFRTGLRLTPFDGTAGTPNVYLTPSGSTVIIEAYQWSDAPDNQRARASTGDVLAYDVRSGALLGRTKIPLSPTQSGRVMGFLENGRTMVYTSNDKLYAVDITSMTVSAAIDLPEGFEPIAAVSTR